MLRMRDDGSPTLGDVEELVEALVLLRIDAQRVDQDGDPAVAKDGQKHDAFEGGGFNHEKADALLPPQTIRHLQ